VCRVQIDRNREQRLKPCGFQCVSASDGIGLRFGGSACVGPRLSHRCRDASTPLPVPPGPCPNLATLCLSSPTTNHKPQTHTTPPPAGCAACNMAAVQRSLTLFPGFLSSWHPHVRGTERHFGFWFFRGFWLNGLPIGADEFLLICNLEISIGHSRHLEKIQLTRPS
jgi:hypothetical protein